MKEDLRRIVYNAASPLLGLNLAKEYLQSRILGILQEAGAMMPLAFCGGTALRFIYGLQRFSEDLDFSLVRAGADFSLDRYIESVVHTLSREGYEIAPIQLKTDKIVQKVMLKFPGLPFELGLSSRANQNISIRLEIDTNPPAGAETEVTVVRKFQLLRLQHLDKPSLFAGKIHAVLAREHTKGRDLYDLAWYLADQEWPGPNMVMLRNALVQTGWTQLRADFLDLHNELANRFEAVNWAAARRDVQPFIENPVEIEILNKKDMTNLLKRLQEDKIYRERVTDGGN